MPGPTGRRYLPDYVKKLVDDLSDYFGTYSPPPASANAYWHRYVQLQYMPRWQVVPIFICVFTIVLYFLGRLFTLGMGRWFVKGFDHAILSIPVVNKVYGSVKQVTDFAFSEREIEFNRVVAIQYPREGIWSLGFVTGDSMREIAEATGEQMLSVLMPTRPMPMTGFTVTVKKSEALDLNLTVDEAIQFGQLWSRCTKPAESGASDREPEWRFLLDPFDASNQRQQRHFRSTFRGTILGESDSQRRRKHRTHRA